MDTRRLEDSQPSMAAFEDSQSINQASEQAELSEVERAFLTWLPSMFGPSIGWCLVRRVCCVPAYPDGLLNRKARNPGFIRFSDGRLQLGTSRWSRRFDVDGLYWQAADLACDVSAWRGQRLEGQPCALSLMFFGSFISTSIQALLHALPDSFWREPLHVSGAYVLHGHSLPIDIWSDQFAASLTSQGGRLCQDSTSLLFALGVLLQNCRVQALSITLAWSSSPGRVTFMGIERGSHLVLDDWLQVPSSKRGQPVFTPVDTAIKKLLEACEASFAGRCPELWILGCVKGDPDAADIKVMERLTRSSLKHALVKEKILEKPASEAQRIVQFPAFLDSNAEAYDVSSVGEEAHEWPSFDEASLINVEMKDKLSHPDGQSEQVDAYSACVLHSTIALYQKDEKSLSSNCSDPIGKAAALDNSSLLPVSMECPSMQAGEYVESINLTSSQDEKYGEELTGSTSHVRQWLQESSCVQQWLKESLQDEKDEEELSSNISSVHQWLQDLDASMAQHLGNRAILGDSQAEDHHKLESTDVLPASNNCMADFKTQLDRSEDVGDRCSEITPDVSKVLETLMLSCSSQNDSPCGLRSSKQADTDDAFLLPDGLHHDSPSDINSNNKTTEANMALPISIFADTSLRDDYAAADKGSPTPSENIATAFEHLSPNTGACYKESFLSESCDQVSWNSCDVIAPTDQVGHLVNAPIHDGLRSFQSACLIHCGISSPCTLQCQQTRDQHTPAPPPPSPQQARVESWSQAEMQDPEEKLRDPTEAMQYKGHQRQLEHHQEQQPQAPICDSQLQSAFAGQHEVKESIQEPQEKEHNNGQQWQFEQQHEQLLQPPTCDLPSQSTLAGHQEMNAGLMQPVECVTKLQTLDDLPAAPTEHSSVDFTPGGSAMQSNEIDELPLRGQRDAARWQRVLAREAAKYNAAELLERAPLEAY